MATCRHLCRTTRFPALVFLPPKIWKTLPLTRQFDAGGDGVAIPENSDRIFPGLESLPQNLEISSFDTTVRRRPDRSRPPQVGPKGHTCTEAADRTEPAKTFRALQPPPFQTPVVFGNSPCFPAEPAEAALAARQNQGGAGGIISDLAVSRRTRSPVCARHIVRPARLARRRQRLTPEVNSGYLPAVGRAPDVARGPSALRDDLPAALPPSPSASA